MVHAAAGAGHLAHVIAVGQGSGALVLGAAGRAAPKVAHKAADVLIAGNPTGVVAIEDPLVVACVAHNTAGIGPGAGNIAGIVAVFNCHIPAHDTPHDAAGGIGGRNVAVVGAVSDGAASQGVHNATAASGRGGTDRDIHIALHMLYDIASEIIYNAAGIILGVDPSANRQISQFRTGIQVIEQADGGI